MSSRRHVSRSERVEDAQRCRQRGPARLGHQRAEHLLPPRVGAGPAPIPRDGARLSPRHRRRGKGAGTQGHRKAARPRGRLRGRRLQRYRSLLALHQARRGSWASRRPPGSPGKHGACRCGAVVCDGSMSYVSRRRGRSTRRIDLRGAEYPGSGPSTHTTRDGALPVRVRGLMRGMTLRGLTRLEGSSRLESAHAFLGDEADAGIRRDRSSGSPGRGTRRPPVERSSRPASRRSDGRGDGGRRRQLAGRSRRFESAAAGARSLFYRGRSSWANRRLVSRRAAWRGLVELGVLLIAGDGPVIHARPSGRFTKGGDAAPRARARARAGGETTVQMFSSRLQKDPGLGSRTLRDGRGERVAHFARNAARRIGALRARRRRRARLIHIVRRLPGDRMRKIARAHASLHGLAHGVRASDELRRSYSSTCARSRGPTKPIARFRHRDTAKARPWDRRPRCIADRPRSSSEKMDAARPTS